jgi:hypothetical protein
MCSFFSSLFGVDCAGLRAHEGASLATPDQSGG